MECRRALGLLALCCATGALFAANDYSRASLADFVPDPDTEQLISKALQGDAEARRQAVAQLAAKGEPAEKALNWHLFNELPNQRQKWAELISQLQRGRVGYRITLELNPDGSGIIELYSNRSCLAHCGRKNDRIYGRPETRYTDDDLKVNPFSRVELLQYMPRGDVMKHMESRVDQLTGDIEARGVLTFKNFDALASFADAFDRGGYYLIAGATLTDSNASQRSYRFRKAAEGDKVLYEKNILLFHDCRWEFVLDLKGRGVGRHNAHRVEGSRLTWSFTCHDVLNGLANIRMSYDAAGLAPRPLAIDPADEAPSAPAAPAADAPVAIVKSPLVKVRAFKRDEVTSMDLGELRSKGFLIELDGRQSKPAEGLAYRWRQTSGPDLNIGANELAKRYIPMIANVAGEYRFELIVNRNGVYSTPAEVRVVVEEAAAPPPLPPTIRRPSDPPVAPEKAAPTGVAAGPANPTVTAANTSTGAKTTPPVAPAKEPAKQQTPPANTTAAVNPEPAKTAPNVSGTGAVKPEPPKTAAVAPATQTPPASPAKTQPDTAVKPAPEAALPSGDPAELAQKGLALLKAGEYAAARDHLLAAVNAKGSDNDARFNLGLAQMELGDYRGAAVQFETLTTGARNVRATMNLGHCLARLGNLQQAAQFYRSGVRADSSVDWETSWQLGHNALKEKDYKYAQEMFATAQSGAEKLPKAKRDWRFYNDLAEAHLHNKKFKEAAAALDVVRELGYTPRKAVAEALQKELGTAPVATETAKPAPAAGTPETGTAKTAVEAPKTPPVEPSKPVTGTPPQVPPPVKPDPAKTVAEAPKNPPNTTPGTPGTHGTAVKPDPRRTPVAEAPKPEPKRLEPKPVPPKRPLPPVPSSYDAAFAAGRKALEDGAKLHSQNTESAKYDAQHKFDEAEAMLRGAWNQRPGDEDVLNEFRELAKYNGAIALVKNPAQKVKVNGLVVLDASPSVGPKDKTLFYVWEQVEGEALNIRPENLARDKVGLRIRRPGMYRFELAVSDGTRGGNPVGVSVEVTE